MAQAVPREVILESYRARQTGQISQIRLRDELGLTQAQSAERVGAAHKAVVYQWEALKRCPSPVFWQWIQALGRDV